ncbi:MAG TPA: peptidylprolyl isomerase [Patescibacteria group bacterium]|nr:peptidylprolyl isomerase [Patescibacteria group bacterium]
MRLLFALLLITVTATAALPAQAAEQRAGARAGIAAIVNDEAITFSDIRNRMHLYMLTMPPNPPPEALKKIEQQTLARLIDERLQMQEAKRLGITVEEAQVESGLAQIANQNKLDAQAFEQKLAAAGVKVSTMQDKVRAEIAWGMVVRRKLRPQVTISETEIDKEVNRLQRDSGKTEYQVAEILITAASAETDNLARVKAGQVVEQLHKGAPFSMIAKQVSQAPGASQGGDLGWLQEGQLDPALDAALAQMEPGQVSAPIKTAKGYHILFLRQKRALGMPAKPAAAAVAAAPAPAAPVQPAATPTPAPAAEPELHLMQIVMPLAAGELQVVTAAKMERARSLKAEIASCEALAAKAADFETANSDLGSRKLSALPPDIRAAVENLADNELSAPVKSANAITVLMVCDRTAPETVAQAETPPAPIAAAPAPAPAQAQAQAPAPAPAPAPASAPLTADASREKIATELGTKRLEQLAERYLKDLRATAYIDKRI